VLAPTFIAPDVAPDTTAEPTSPLYEAWVTTGLIPLPPLTPRQESARAEVHSRFSELTESNRNLYFRFNLLVALQAGIVVLYAAAMSQLGSSTPTSPTLRALGLLALAGVLNIWALNRSLWSLVHHRNVLKRPKKHNVGIAALEADPFDDFKRFVRRTEQLDGRVVRGRKRFWGSVLATSLSIWLATAAGGVAALAYPISTMIPQLFS
jgi:hypothetical protein